MRRFLIAGLLAAVAVPVLAQTAAPVAPVAPPAPPAPIARIAPMADKIVTRAEVDAKVREHFAKLDANKDGFVAGDELTHGRKHPGGAWQGENSVVEIKHEHAMGDPNAAFDRIDTDKNGAISREEFAKGRELRIEKRIAMHHDGAIAGHPGAMRMRMHHMGGGMMGRHLLKMADSDKDGRVSLAEATAGAMQHFDKVDTNRDGRITPDERCAGRVMFKQMRSPAAS